MAPTGQAWADLSGGWDVASGLAAPEAGYSLSVVDGGGPDGVVSVSLVEPSPEFWLVLRASDGASYWRFGRWQSGPYQLQQIANNALGSPAVTTHATATPAAGDAISCQLTASTLGCSVNGIAVVSTADRFNGSASGLGFAAWSPSGPSPARFDDLLVTDLEPAPDAAVAVTDVDPVVVGGELHWTATVTNVGGGPADAVSLAAPVPDGVSGLAAVPSSGTCSVVAAVTCELGSIAPGASVAVDVTGTAPMAAGTVVLAVEVSTGGDAVPGNDAEAESTTINDPSPTGARVADGFNRPDSSTLGVTDTGAPWSVASGAFGVVGGRAVPSSSGYDLALVDGGGSSGDLAVSVVEPSPEFWLVLRASDGASYWRFGRQQSGPYQLQQVVNNALGTPSMTTHATITPAAGDRLACRYHAAVVECFVNGVIVTTATGAESTAHAVGLAAWSPGGSPVPAFDELVVTEPAAAPDVAVAIADDDPVLAGGQLRWSVDVTNVGTSTATDVGLVLTLPAVAGVAVSAGQGSCVVDAVTTCSLGDLAPGALTTVTVTATASSTPQVLTVEAAVDAAGDEQAWNDASSESTTVRNAPAPGQRVIDEFDRSQTGGLGVTDTGESWTVHSGAFAVEGGEARATTAQLGVASVDSGFAFGTFELVVTDVGSGGFWAVFRVVDGQNYYRVGPGADGYYRLERVVDGVPQGLQFLVQRADILAADGDVLRIINRPDDGMFVSVNGEHLLDAGDVRSMDASRFGFVTSSTSVRIGKIDVGQVMSSAAAVVDAFDRPNAPSLGTPSSGVSYEWFGNLGITGGQAYYAGSYYGLAVVDATSEAADVSVRLAQISDEFALVFRYSESGTYYRFGRLHPGGGYEVDLVSGNASSAPPAPVEVLAAPVPANGDLLTVRQHLDGTVEGLVNGVVVLRFQDPDTNRRSTYYGMATGGSSGARFDDFTVEPE